MNDAIDDAAFTIPDDVRRAFAAAPAAGVSTLTLDRKRSVEVAPGIIQYSGAWNVAFVDQPDGIVIIEAPIGSRYSAEVLDEAGKRYPGKKVKAVLTTSDAWPHLGGVREYVARGIPVYAFHLNRPILERLLKADYSAHPDTLAKSPRSARFMWVSGKTVLGTGDNRLELYPVRGENGERMMAAYLPALKLLYTSDEIQRQRAGGFFMPEYLLEVRDTIQREHLAVDWIFGFHVGPTPWSEIEAAIAAALPVARSRVRDRGSQRCDPGEAPDGSSAPSQWTARVARSLTFGRDSGRRQLCPRSSTIFARPVGCSRSIRDTSPRPC